MNSVGQFALGVCALAVLAPMFIGSDQIFSLNRENARGEVRRTNTRAAAPRNTVIEGRSEIDSKDIDDEPEEQSVALGTAVSYRGANGHFNFEADMNGEYIEVMVDTGASSVAINRSTAEQMGIEVSDQDFVHTANTANGTTEYARVTIESIRIGDITVNDVEASVLSDKSLDNVLLGMSFLKHVKMVTDGDRMILSE